MGNEFWLGNDILHLLTTHRSYTLRVDLEDWDGGTAYAEYRYFFVSSEEDKYRLHIIEYTGTAGERYALFP